MTRDSVVTLANVEVVVVIAISSSVCTATFPVPPRSMALYVVDTG